MGEGVGELSGAAGGDEFGVDVGEVQGGVLVGGGAEDGVVVVPGRLPAGSSGLDIDFSLFHHQDFQNGGR